MNYTSPCRLLIALLLLANCSDAAEDQQPDGTDKKVVIKDGELLVTLGGNPSAAETRVTELLAERIKDRAGIQVVRVNSKPALRLVIGTTASNEKSKFYATTHKSISELGPDGYSITLDSQSAELHVIGQSDSGVVAGVGRLMREIRYHPGKIEIPALDIAQTPQMPNRGMYLWARKYYFNQPDKLERYIEELALWGCNGICFWFEMGMFESFEDTTGKKSELDTRYAKQYKLDESTAEHWVELYQRFYKTARRLGMKTGLLMVANDAYMSSPKYLRIEPIIGCPDWYLCPSKPGSVEMAVKWHEQVFKTFAPLDIYNIFPADPGACSCEQCTPWPTQGFWRVAKPIGDRIHAISPKTKIWIDTWHLNHPTFGGKDWKNLVGSLDTTKQVPEWFSGFEVGLAPHHKFAQMGAEDIKVYNDSKRPLMVFSEISMYRNHEGMLVKKGYWESLQDELNSYDAKLMMGGWIYAERWNTDLATVAHLSWYWDSKTPIDRVLDNYAALYFGPEAETGRELLDLLDDGNNDTDRKQKIRETLAKLATTVPAWVKRDWRWHEVEASALFKSR